MSREDPGNDEQSAWHLDPEVDEMLEVQSNVFAVIDEQLKLKRAQEADAAYAPPSPTPAHPHKVAAFKSQRPEELAREPAAFEVIPPRFGDCINHAAYVYEETGAFVGKDGAVYLRCHQPNNRKALDACRAVLDQSFDWPRDAPWTCVHAIVDWDAPGPFKRVEVQRKWTPARNGSRGTDYYYRIRPAHSIT